MPKEPVKEEVRQAKIVPAGRASAPKEFSSEVDPFTGPFVILSGYF